MKAGIKQENAYTGTSLYKGKQSKLTYFVTLSCLVFQRVS